MKKKLLTIYIIGSNGFLGSKLKTRILDNKNFKLVNKRIEKKIDFSCKIKSVKILQLLNPDIIINCAGKTNIEFCELNKKAAYKSNVLILKNLSKYCKLNQKKLIHISTDHFYNKKIGFSNENQVKIINYYAKSKYQGEIYAKKCNSIILRTNFFGFDQRKKKSNLINWIVSSSIIKKKIKIFTNIFFSPMYVETLISIIIKILDSKLNGTFNVGTVDNISKSEFIKNVAKILGLKLKYEYVKYDQNITKIKRPINMSMNTQKFQKKFNIKLPKIKNEIKKLIFDKRFFK